MYASFETNPAKVFHCLRCTYIQVHLAYQIYDQLGKLLVERLLHCLVICAHLSVTIPCPVGSLLPRFSDIVRWRRRMYSTTALECRAQGRALKHCLNPAMCAFWLEVLPKARYIKRQGQRYERLNGIRCWREGVAKVMAPWQGLLYPARHAGLAFVAGGPATCREGQSPSSGSWMQRYCTRYAPDHKGMHRKEADLERLHQVHIHKHI